MQERGASSGDRRSSERRVSGQRPGGGGWEDSGVSVDSEKGEEKREETSAYLSVTPVGAGESRRRIVGRDDDTTREARTNHHAWIKVSAAQGIPSRKRKARKMKKMSYAGRHRSTAVTRTMLPAAVGASQLGTLVIAQKKGPRRTSTGRGRHRADRYEYRISIEGRDGRKIECTVRICIIPSDWHASQGFTLQFYPSRIEQPGLREVAERCRAIDACRRQVRCSVGRPGPTSRNPEQ